MINEFIHTDLIIDRFFLFSLAAFFSLALGIIPYAKPLFTALFEFIAGTLERKLNRTERPASARRLRGQIVCVFMILCAVLFTRGLEWLILNMPYDDKLLLQVPILSLFVASSAIWARHSRILKRIDTKKSKEAASLLTPLTQDELKSSDIFQLRRQGISSVARAFERYLIGPWLWFSLGGYLFLCLYAIFTAFKFTSSFRHSDSRIYAKWGVYIDQLLNFIPARIAALLLVTGGFLTFKASGISGLKNFFGFRNKLNNINAGQVLSVMAGATKTILAGPNKQRGITTNQPWIGDQSFTVKPDGQAYGRAITLHMVTTMLAILGAALPMIYLLFYK